MAFYEHRNLAIVILNDEMEEIGMREFECCPKTREHHHTQRRQDDKDAGIP
jgi:hypothetical protein